MNQWLEKFQNFFGPLSYGQRAIFIGLVTVVIVAMAGLFYWTLKPDYSLLFGSMPADAAQEVVEELEERGISYRLEDGGRTIYVPSREVHEMRLSLASEGFARSDLQGYELFDESALGMTDFMQQINNKRALEGELARSINTMEQVEFSRVHLVLPERRPFREASVEASASVILNLQRGESLAREQVAGITSLISGSVEGLDGSGVTVLDQHGNRLTDGLESHASGSGSLQIQLREKTEEYLSRQGQSMLDRVLGPGNAIVRVSAEHDFDRIMRESDLIDPDTRTILSEERRTEASNDEVLEQVPFDEFTPMDLRGETVITSNQDHEYTTQIRNYDVSRTREIFERTEGELERLSATVLLNYRQTVQTNEQGEEVLVSEPYTQEEVQEFREVVRTALGIQPDRGDELTITQIEFYDPMGVDRVGYMGDPVTDWREVIRWVAVLLTFLAIAGILYSMRNRMEGESDAIVLRGQNTGSVQNIEWDEPINETGLSEGENADEFIAGKMGPEAQKQLEERKYELQEIKDFVLDSPSVAAQVVRVMMITDDK